MENTVKFKYLYDMFIFICSNILICLLYYFITYLYVQTYLYVHFNYHSFIKVNFHAENKTFTI